MSFMIIDRGDAVAALGDRYELGGEIGSGSHGLVYAGYDRQERRPVAIKFIRAYNDPVRLSFKDEAQFLLDDRHPNVVRVYDYRIHEERRNMLFILVMEILPVRFNQLMASTALSTQQVCALIFQAAEGLHEAWVKRRLLHLDVKPGNLMITSDGVVRVTDFGIAKEMDRSPEQAIVTAPSGTWRQNDSKASTSDNTLTSTPSAW
jgi:serine/threonine-protein kinase